MRRFLTVALQALSLFAQRRLIVPRTRALQYQNAWQIPAAAPWASTMFVWFRLVIPRARGYYSIKVLGRYRGAALQAPSMFVWLGHVIPRARGYYSIKALGRYRGAAPQALSLFALAQAYRTTHEDIIISKRLVGSTACTIDVCLALGYHIPHESVIISRYIHDLSKRNRFEE